MGAAALIPSLLPLFMVMAIRRAERRIHRQLSDAGAFTVESAVPLSPSGSREKGRLQDLVRGGAVRLASSDRYFLDADGWNSYQSRRRRRALIALSVVVVLVSVGFAVLFAMR